MCLTYRWHPRALTSQQWGTVGMQKAINGSAVSVLPVRASVSASDEPV